MYCLSKTMYMVEIDKLILPYIFTKGVKGTQILQQYSSLETAKTIAFFSFEN